MRYSILAMLLLSTAAAVAQAPEPPAPPPETVNVRGKPLTDEAVGNFVKTFTEPSLLSGKIPRWFGGICMKTQGLAPELNEAVTGRVLEVAIIIGAPVQKQPCTSNVVAIFDKNPQAVMDAIADKTPDLLGPHEVGQVTDMAKVRFPVQAWYATATRDDKGATSIDTRNQSAECDSVDLKTVGASIDGFRGSSNVQAAVISNLQQKCGRRDVTGNRLRDGIHSQMSTVTVVGSLETMDSHDLAAMADYLALVILSQTKAFGACEKMDTVANLLVPGCDPGSRIAGLTPGDMAFLKALYRADTGGTLVMQQASIREEMKKLLNAP